MTAGSCPPPGLSRAIASVIGCGLGCTPINALSIGLSPAPGSCCEVRVVFVPHSWAAPSYSGTEIEVTQADDDATGVDGQVLVDALFLCVGADIRVEHMVRQWDRMPRGKR